MADEKEEEYFQNIGRNLTYVYSEFIVRFKLITEMIVGTEYNWTRYFKTQQRWMGNSTILPDGSLPDYMKLRHLGS